LNRHSSISTPRSQPLRSDMFHLFRTTSLACALATACLAVDVLRVPCATAGDLHELKLR